MKPLLIGICGPARAGKDTVANILIEHWGFQRYSLASPIKMMLASLGLDDDELNGDKKEAPLARLKIDKSPRQLMQTLGTEWGRDQVDADFWLKLAAFRWNQAREAGQLLVIPDVRFDNEAAFIRRNGHLVHISRPNAPQVAAHSSERGIAFDERRDHALVNDGGIDWLEVDVAFLMGKLARGAAA